MCAGAVCVCVTIVRDDAPGSKRGIQASQHPKHAEPAQMFSSFIHLQELSEVGIDYWDGAANAEEGIVKCVRLQKKCFLYSAQHSIMIYYFSFAVISDIKGWNLFRLTLGER